MHAVTHFVLLTTLVGVSIASLSPAELVDQLNQRYKDGRPSNSADEAGIIWRSFDSFADTTQYGPPTRGYKIEEDEETAKKMFAGTAAHPENLPATLINDDISSNKYGINLFRSWSLAGLDPSSNNKVFGPPAGVIYSSCALDRGLKCSYLQSANSDGRINAGCGRQEKLGLPAGFPLAGCKDDHLFYLAAEENSATHEDVSLEVGHDAPTELTADGAEAELLFNRNISPMLGIYFANDTVAQQFQERLANSDMQEAYDALPEFRTDFYVDEVGTCVDISKMYALAFPDGDDAPPLIWIDLENTHAPFGLTCDKADVCGREASRPSLRGSETLAVQ